MATRVKVNGVRLKLFKNYEQKRIDTKDRLVVAHQTEGKSWHTYGHVVVKTAHGIDFCHICDYSYVTDCLSKMCLLTAARLQLALDQIRGCCSGVCA